MPSPSSAGDPAFPTTHWTLIRGVQSLSAEERRRALEELCRTYWYPIYCFTRRRGLGIEEAEDAVQDFFARMLERDAFAAADQEKGRLRTWLLTQLHGCLADRARRHGRTKRGGGAQILSLDALAAESRYRHEPATDESPEVLFERTCAREIVEQALAELRAQYAARGQGERFDSLRPLLSGEPSPGEREEVCRRLGLRDGALRVALHRLRDALGNQLRRRVEAMVKCSDDIESELAEILRDSAL